MILPLIKVMFSLLHPIINIIKKKGNIFLIMCYDTFVCLYNLYNNKEYS